MLPLVLQRAAGVPRSDAAWEAAFARRSFASLCASAPRVTFSWAAREGERERRASPLLAGLPQAPAQAPPPGASERLRASGAVESLVDVLAPELAQGTPVEGGARLVEDQSACPFRAFARHRLGAATLVEGLPGLDAVDRGTLLHDALAVLWRGIGSSVALLAATPQDRDARVAVAVDDALGRFWRRRGERLTPALRELEAERLSAAIGSLLEQEALRAPFTVVACEVEREVSVGGLALRARLDRVDELADGRRVVIDYKSGRARTRQWDGERPEQPQLPLYAVTEPAPVAAVAFGILRPGEVGFAGAGDGADLLPGVQDWSGVPGGWEGTLDRWRAVVAALAGEFLRGRADVSPRDGLKTCTHCELGPLCRVREALAGEPGEEGDGGES
jgi:probable DNA repair protein